MDRISTHPKHWLACVALLVLARPVVAQQPSAGTAPVCRQPHYIAPSDLTGIAGMYELSNGDFLAVRKESRQFYAEMGKTGRMEIIPLNENEFAEKGGTVRFRFDRDQPLTDVAIAGLDAPRSGMNPCVPAVH